MKKENSELAARMALLADETPDFEAGRRRLPDGDPFVEILTLIDQTVIATVLEITNDDRVILIEVSERRLCRLPGLIEELTASVAGNLADAVHRIVEFADSAEGPLYVRGLTSDPSGIDPAKTVAIRTIAAAAGRRL